MLSTPDGEELTLEIVEKGRLFGESSFLSKSLRPTTVTAVTDVDLICCAISQLIPCLCENPDLLTKVLQHCSETMNHLSYSHDEIAMCLGLARPTVSQVLKEFEQKGGIKCAYRKVYILDRESLAGAEWC